MSIVPKHLKRKREDDDEKTPTKKPRIAKDKNGNFVEHIGYNDREFLEASPEEQMKIIRKSIK